MEAARKINNQRVAREYLDRKPELEVKKEPKQKKYLLENILMIGFVVVSCFCVFCLLVFPVFKEARLHEFKAREYTYKVKIMQLNKSIEESKKILDSKRVMTSIENEAIKIGLVRKNNVSVNKINSNKYYTLENAKNSYYNINYDISNK